MDNIKKTSLLHGLIGLAVITFGIGSYTYYVKTPSYVVDRQSNAAGVAADQLPLDHEERVRANAIR